MLLFFSLSAKIRGENNISEALRTIPLVKKGVNEKVWYGNIGGFLRISTGNVKEVKSNGNVYGQYNDGILDLKVTFDFVLNNVYIPELGKNYISEDKKITKVTADYFVLNRLELFSFATNEYDRRKNHLYRNDCAVGAKFVVFRNMYWLLDFSYAPTFQHEKYSNEDNRYEARHSLRAKTEVYFFDKRIKTNCIFFYIPIIDFREYRISLSTYIEIVLSKLSITQESSLTFKFEYKFEQNPYCPVGVKKLDNLYVMSLQLYL